MAAPVELGMMLSPPALPSLQSLALGPSTDAYPPVTAWIVVINPSSIPHLSLTILAKGAKQFVVHEAFETIFMSEVNSLWFTPTTKVGVSGSLPGADKITFLAPPLKCLPAEASSRKIPVDSQTTSTPWSPHGTFPWSNSVKNLTFYPFTSNPSSNYSTVPSNLPWAVS